MLKLKSGGLRYWDYIVTRDEKFTFFHSHPPAHLPPPRQRRIHHHLPHPRRDHHREIRDYRAPPAVFIRNQLQGFRASLPPVVTRLQFTSMLAERFTLHRSRRSPSLFLVKPWLIAWKSILSIIPSPDILNHDSRNFSTAASPSYSTRSSSTTSSTVTATCSDIYWTLCETRSCWLPRTFATSICY